MNLKGIFSRRSSGQLESDQPDAPQGRQQALPRASQDRVLNCGFGACGLGAVGL